MCDAIGCPVRRLIRMRIGPIELGDLASGEHRSLTAIELRRLRAAVGLSTPARRGQARRGSTARGSARRKGSSGERPRSGTSSGRSSNRRPPGEKRSGRKDKA